MITHTDLKFYCCPKGFPGDKSYDQWKSRSDHPLLPLDRTSNVAQNLSYCAPSYYRNSLGDVVSNEHGGGRYTGSIEFDVSAPLLCPEEFHRCWAWVDCVSQFGTFWFDGKKNIKLDRHPVEGSLFIHPDQGESTPLSDGLYDAKTRTVSVEEGYKRFYITYRPCLLMFVPSVEQRIKEDDGSGRWKIDLEE